MNSFPSRVPKTAFAQRPIKRDEGTEAEQGKERASLPGLAGEEGCRGGEHGFTNTWRSEGSDFFWKCRAGSSPSLVPPQLPEFSLEPWTPWHMNMAMSLVWLFIYFWLRVFHLII